MGSYSHETGFFSGKGGEEIFFQKWLTQKAKAVLIIIHGLGEHSGRYKNLITALDGKDLSIYGIDHRGHGKSQGKKGNIESFMDYIYDLKLFVEYVKEENKGLPIILYGHSMGGVIAAKYALTYQDDSSAVVLSSPGFAPAFTVPGWKKSLASFFSSRIGSLTMPNGLSPNDISRDMDAVREYENDPLVHNKVSARWFTEFLKAGQECIADAPMFKKPLLVFHSKGDRIADYRASEDFYRNAGSKVKEIFLYEDMYHEVINELEVDREKALKDIATWILENTISSKKETVKKPAADKTAAKKAAVKTAAKKTAAGKTSTGKPAAAKASAKKSTVKKTPPAGKAVKASSKPKGKSEPKAAAKKKAAPTKVKKK